MKRVLIIEDDEGVCEVIAAALSQYGYEALTAADGKEGLKIYRETPTDLVITDLIMPGKEGIETIVELLHGFPGARVIAISGHGEANLRMAKSLGALRTLSKPFHVADLLEAVQEVLETPAP